MAITTVETAQQSTFTNQILHGDCIDVMKQMPANSVDFILTDPPYLVNYRDRSGRTTSRRRARRTSSRLSLLARCSVHAQAMLEFL